MNTAADAERFDPVHVRVLDDLLALGQADSCTALIDLDSGAVLSRGNGSQSNRPIDGKLLAALGQSVFATGPASGAGSDVRSLCASLGGVAAVAVIMRESSLILLRLSASSRVLALVVRHRPTSASASETIVQARAVRARLESQAAPHPQAGAAEAAQRDSIWQALVGRTAKAAPPELLRQAVGNDGRVVVAELFDLDSGAHIDHFRDPRAGEANKPDTRAATQALADLFDGRLDVRPILRHFGFAGAPYGKVQLQIGGRDFHWLRAPFFPAMHIAFDPRAALLLYRVPRPSPALEWTALDFAGLELLRLRTGALLGSGMNTEMFPFPPTHIEFQGIVERLGALQKDDLMGRLAIGGFAPHPVEIDGVMQRCQECIYYLPHRRWCDLPELPLPVEPDWWCRLWKI